VASQARRNFDKNADDIVRLLEIHGDLGGSARGRRYRLEVLNKSAIVLITSFWEAYCEDLAAEALEHILKHSRDADALSKDIKKLVAKELEGDPNQLAVWSLADDGWRRVLQGRLSRLQEERNRRLNTPKSENIDQLFLNALGIPKVSSSWRWHKVTAAQARDKLDKYVNLRGEIAHRGAAASGCKKVQVEDYFAFMKRLVGKTGGRVNLHVVKMTGRAMW
jgi:RiboL-PSP-HEPN